MSYGDPFPVGVGGFPIRRVSQAAGAMANILAEVIRLKQISPPYRSRSFFVKKALRFINLALQALEENPDSKSLRASIIALKAILVLTKTSVVPSDEEPKKLLNKFSLLLTRLEQKEGELSEEELKTAGQLREFFREIDRAGAEIDFNFSDFMEGP